MSSTILTTFCQPLIPTHLLRQSAPSPSPSQVRCFSSLFPLRPAGFRKFSNSTSLSRLRLHAHRYVHGQSTHRYVPSAEPENIPATSICTWSEYRLRVSLRKLQDAPSVLPSMGKIWKAGAARYSYTRAGHGDHATSSSNTLLPRVRTQSIQQPSQTPTADSHITSTDGIAPLAHLTSDGEAHMVSIANKKPTSRSATATALLLFSQERTYNSLFSSLLKKGDALAVARVAGIQAAKKTGDLIPLAHPGLSITGVTVRLEPFQGRKLPFPLDEASEKDLSTFAGFREHHGGVLVTATVGCEGKTGVEMEAIISASTAGLTLYDMLKGVDKCMVLTNVRVVKKSGGKSGDWQWDHKRGERIITQKPQQGQGDKAGANEGPLSATNTPAKPGQLPESLQQDSDPRPAEQNFARQLQLAENPKQQIPFEQTLERLDEQIKQSRVQRTIQEGKESYRTKGLVTGEDFLLRRKRKP